MSLQSFWIHGNSVQQEREGYFISKRRSGHGAIFQTHGEEWFHFAIPTPIILKNHRSSLWKFFLLYKTSGTATIKRVHVYEGPRLIHSEDGPGNNGLRDFNGDHSQKVDEKNSWELPQRIEIRSGGIGISVQVNFGPPTKTGIPSFTFVSAGADFSNEGV